LRNDTSLLTTSEEAVTWDDLQQGAGATGPCITLLTSIQEPSAIKTQLKNAVREARRQVADFGADEHLLDPVQDLVSALEIEKRWANALIVLRSPQFFRYWWLRGAFQETVAVGDRFHMRPLFRVMASPQQFYLLAISGKHVHLFHATQHRMERVALDAAEDLREWMNIREPDHELRNRSTAGPSLGTMKGVVFGSNSDQDREDEYLRLFLTSVASAVTKTLREDSAPLILAGVERDVAFYRKANTYPYLLDAAIPGSPDGVPEQQLHDRGWELASQAKPEQLTKALADYERLSGRRRFAIDLREIIEAAFQGRILDLFLQEGASLLGTWDAATNRVSEDGHEDLVNAAAQETVLQGGRAFELPAADMPVKGPAAAALRY